MKNFGPSASVTLNAGSASTATIKVEIPDGYAYGGIVGVRVSEWHCAVLKFDWVNSTSSVSVNLVNAGTSKQTATSQADVLLIPV